MKKLLILFSLFLMTGISLGAQVPAAQRALATAELQKRGLSEAEVEQRLQAKGVNLETVDISNPAEVARVQKAVEAVIAELEAEKNENSSENVRTDTGEEVLENVEDAIEEKIEQEVEKEAKEIAKEGSVEITEAVKDGATVEEAISEELAEQVQEDLGESPIYGQHIFRNQTIDVYRPDGDFNPPDAYVLGSGDKIAISIWGISQADLSFEIDDRGKISPTAMPGIDLGGLTFGKAKEKIKARFSQYYQFRPEEFDMTVKTARIITVNVFGEAETYGSFTIPAFNTAFNALVAAGGPSNIGSVRDIRLIRGNKTKKLDVYKFMTDPTVQFDFYLENNDIIYIPIAEKLVTLQGAVKRPFAYELLPEENLSSLIEYAGGLKTNAYQKNIQITRIEGDKERLIDVNLRELVAQNRDFPLKNGDRIIVRTIPETYENFVEIKGAVKLPGKYALQNNMKLSDLISKGVLDDQARLDFAFLQRTNSDRTVRYERIPLQEILKNTTSAKNFTLKKEDKVTIFASTSYIEKANISISGAIRNPGEFQFDPTRTLKLEDIILLAGGLEPNANQFAYIQRIDTTNRERRDFIRVNVFKALEDSNARDNITLEPYDKVTIYANESFTDDATVSVGGAVREPKEIPYDSTFRVSDLINLSDGLRPDATDFAYIERTDIANEKEKEYIRVDIKSITENPKSAENLLLEPFDKVNIYSNTDFTEQFNVSIEGSVRNPGEFQFDPSLTLSDIVTLAGGFKLEADKSRIDIYRVLISEDKTTTEVLQIGMDKNFKITSGSGQNLELFPFDKIIVRQVPDFDLQEMVTVTGEVNYPGTYALTGNNEQLSSIIERAGGLSIEAFPEGATLNRTEGGYGQIIMKMDKVLKGRSKKFDYVLKPGDVISVPKAKDLVSISGATDVHELYQDKVLGNGGRINVAYHGARRARYYVRKFAGGKADNGSWKKLTVEHPNGEIRNTRNFGLFTLSPRVRKGSEILVGYKLVEAKKEEPKGNIKQNAVDWDKTLSQVLSVTTVLATLLIAINR